MERIYEKLVEKRNLQKKLYMVEKEIEKVTLHVQNSEEIMYKEQEDVKRLKRFSFANLKMSFSSKREELLKKAEQEMMNAVLLYEDAVQQLQQLKLDKQYYENKLLSYEKVEDEYGSFIQERMQNETTSEFAFYAEKALHSLAFLNNIKKALVEYKNVISVLEEAKDELAEADSWMQVSFVRGNGFSNSERRQSLSRVEKIVRQLYRQLGIYKKALAPLHIKVDEEDYLLLSNFTFSKMFGSYSTLKGQIINAQICLDNSEKKLEENLRELFLLQNKEENKQDEIHEWMMKMRLLK